MRIKKQTESKQDETIETEIKTMYDLQGWIPKYAGPQQKKIHTKEEEEKEESKSHTTRTK